VPLEPPAEEVTEETPDMPVSLEPLVMKENVEHPVCPAEWLEDLMLVLDCPVPLVMEVDPVPHWSRNTCKCCNTPFTPRLCTLLIVLILPEAATCTEPPSDIPPSTWTPLPEPDTDNPYLLLDLVSLISTSNPS